MQDPDLGPNNWAARLFWLDRPRTYRAVVWTYIFGSACHLWLADAAQDAWFVPNVVYAIGLILLALRSYPLGWLFTSIGTALPIFFLRDQLTQSIYLLAVSSLCFGFEVYALFVKRRLVRPIARVLRTISVLGIATYAIAGLHKLNRDFLEPATSCAVYGIDKLEQYYGLPITAFAWADPYLPLFAVIFEWSIPIFYLVGQKRLAWIAAVIFHIPLTITMAPAFAFVMAVGHVASMSEGDLRWFRTTLKKRGLVIGLAAATITAASLGAHGAWPEPTMVPKEWLLWFSLGALLFAPKRPVSEARVAKPITAVVMLYILNGFSPYLGVQYQHAAAMLSNLRIDEGCWNSSVVPESMRLTEDYVRIDSVYFRKPGLNTEYEEIVRTQLWSPPQILQMRRNWCRDESRPLFLSGTFRGDQWTIHDLCAAEQVWPFESDGIFGVEVFSDFLRFQKNLERECPQACIH